MGSNNDKGKLLEDVVAKLHEIQGLRIIRNKKISTKSNPNRKREFDIIIESLIGPYRHEVVVECKNKGKPVGIDLIDAFHGKLNATGMNVRGAIYVSPNGFTRGASDSARDLGMVLLSLDGLTKDRLNFEIYRANSGTLYVFPSLTSFALITKATESPLPALFNTEGIFGGTIFDLIWKCWMEWQTLKLGTYDGEVAVPDGWGSIVDGKFIRIDSVSFKGVIEGHLLLRSGVAARVALREGVSKEVIAENISASFGNPLGKFELLRITSEETLGQIMAKDDPSFTALLRVKIPKVITDMPDGRFPWMPSDDLWRQLKLMVGYRTPFFASAKPQKLIIGTDVSSLFDPPYEYSQLVRPRLGIKWDPGIWKYAGLE